MPFRILIETYTRDLSEKLHTATSQIKVFKVHNNSIHFSEIFCFFMQSVFIKINFSFSLKVPTESIKQTERKCVNDPKLIKIDINHSLNTLFSETYVKHFFSSSFTSIMYVTVEPRYSASAGSRFSCSLNPMARYILKFITLILLFLSKFSQNTWLLSHPYPVTAPKTLHTQREF